MARFDELPVYKQTYDFLLILYRDMSGLPRDLKFTILQDIKRESIGIMEQIYKANASRDKLPYIDEAKRLLLGVKIKIRILNDLHSISNKLFSQLASITESISKQLTMWYNYCKEK